MPTTVVNKYKDKYDVLIGRTSSPMHWGNPFSHLENSRAAVRVASREEAIDAFRNWMCGTAYQEVEPRRRQWMLNNVLSLRGKVLGCFCRPKACHGDVLAEMADADF